MELDGVGCLARLRGRTRKRAPAQRSGAPSLGRIPTNIVGPLLRPPVRYFFDSMWRR